jgi:hypothetical protein
MEDVAKCSFLVSVKRKEDDPEKTVESPVYTGIMGVGERKAQAGDRFPTGEMAQIDEREDTLCCLKTRSPQLTKSLGYWRRNHNEGPEMI